jgi:heme o synthase
MDVAFTTSLPPVQHTACDQVSMSVTLSDVATASTAPLGGQGEVGDYWALMKPRVMSLVVFSGIVGAVAAPGVIHPWMAFVITLCIAVAAGACGALNMAYDADIDAIMARTANRPIPRGALTVGEAYGFGAFLAVASVLVLGLFTNVFAAAFLAFTIFFYVVIYTMWLKRWTPQNIVIGGAAGAFPPAVAWAAASGGLDAGAIVLFLIVFMWTPPHFWALALFREGDYGRAGVPMLPNVSGRTETKRQILIYNLLLMPTVLLPLVTGIGGWVYGIGAFLLTSKFLWQALVLYRTAERSPEEDKASKKLFGVSIYWLFALLGLLLAEQVLNLPVFPALL